MLKNRLYLPRAIVVTLLPYYINAVIRTPETMGENRYLVNGHYWLVGLSTETKAMDVAQYSPLIGN